MIHCYLILCLVSNPAHCQPEVEITPTDHIVTSPIECGRGGLTLFSSARMAQQTPEEASKAPVWFAKTRAQIIGDGSDIVRAWVAEQKARAAATAPQIK